MTDMRINPGTGLPIENGAVGKKNNAAGFSELLQKTVQSVNESMQEADSSAAGLMRGEHANIHETMIAMEKANIKFRLLTRAQNKVVDAYKEILRMQL